MQNPEVSFRTQEVIYRFNIFHFKGKWRFILALFSRTLHYCNRKIHILLREGCEKRLQFKYAV